jgi:hypothetical protein
VSSTAVQTGTSSVAVVRRELAAIAKLPSKDPFQAQLGTGDAGSSTQLPSLAKEPRVRTSHFVVKNPFKVLIGAPATTAAVAPLAKAPVVTPAKVVKASAPVTTLVGYVVVLRSLDSAAAARQEVKRAHAQGLVSAAILYSSRYSTLRHGYWVVYLNRYPTMAAANAGLQEARAHGYASAYRRPVRKVTNR